MVAIRYEARAQSVNPTAARRDSRLFLALLGAKRSVRFDLPPCVLQCLLQYFGIERLAGENGVGNTRNTYGRKTANDIIVIWMG
ncbi:hypothetical protein F11_10960 [Rhodospirillum rubrum F11]|nr:hypothetical protein F11_10960 [Rhodospirillum rubrum F11]MBK5954549.1 hypothetical protein [Rhodospirillum rubrum]HAP99470.1 hypothetical protein [Rhodospirillum rubrum]HCF17620.1 hypothetical protein [Rhodospirillum rubrum]